ncbi:MAG TPA: ATPase domain-containing protein, partial [Chloroflexota bacterium]|nr:ATPase domain-containing protein [Chloroflexota bacterium]
MEGPTPGPLLATGIPNLDLVLGGGVPEGDVLLVVGPAGAGKTTLSFQMLVHAAASGQNVLYVATLSEPPSKLLRHLRSYTFYDERFIGKRLFLLNTYPLLTQSLDALTDALVSAVKEHQATLVVVDGMMTIHDLHPASAEFRQFVYELGAILAAQGCTTVVTTGEIPRELEYQFPEFTMADGVVELGTENVGTRTTRTLRVRKLRGQSPLLGQHLLRIDDAGLTVFPRPESVIPMANVGLSPARVSIGLPVLDTLMHGGPHRGSITLLAGSLGTGKTLSCLEFLMDGANRGEKGLLLGFRETPRQLLDKARA